MKSQAAYLQHQTNYEHTPPRIITTDTFQQPPREITSVQSQVRGRIIETGHYYQCKGPTAWSKAGLAVAEKIRQPNDSLMLFIDDVHPIDDVSAHEVSLPTVELDVSPDFTFMESDVANEAFHFLNLLKDVTPRKKKAKLEHGSWYCSGFPLTDAEGNPLCVLLDAGLTLRKHNLGFKNGVNVLPKFYEEEQYRLKRLLRKVLPEFDLSVILFDLDGNHWSLPE